MKSEVFEGVPSRAWPCFKAPGLGAFAAAHIPVEEVAGREFAALRAADMFPLFQQQPTLKDKGQPPRHPTPVQVRLLFPSPGSDPSLVPRAHLTLTHTRFVLACRVRVCSCAQASDIMSPRSPAARWRESIPPQLSKQQNTNTTGWLQHEQHVARPSPVRPHHGRESMGSGSNGDHRIRPVHLMYCRSYIIHEN